MEVLKQLNLLVAFLLEVVLLIFAGIWGYQLAEIPLLKYALAIALPVFIAALWGIWAAPKSKRRLKNPGRTIFKLPVLLLAVFFSYQTGYEILAISLAIMILANVGLAFAFAQDY